MRNLLFWLMAFFSMTFVACGDDSQGGEGDEIKDEIAKEDDTSNGEDGKDDETPKEEAPVYCDDGRLKCGDVCVSPNSPDNCGACGNACLSAENCRLEDGKWACRCQVGNERCDGVCVPVDTAERCGSCFNQCIENERCERSGGMYRCLCYDGDQPVDMDADVKNCGSCGYVCPSWRDGMGGIKNSGEEQCINSVCVCDNGLSSCEDSKGHMQICAFDLMKGLNEQNDVVEDYTHCGACNYRCDYGFVCVEGVCMCGEKETCKDGEWCFEGLCRCGDDMSVCSNDERCEDGFCKCLNDDACGSRGSCDLETGQCLCGDLGASCRDGETCVDGACKCGNSEACSAELICKAGLCVCKANGDKACPAHTVCTSEGCLCGTKLCEDYEYCFKNSKSETYCLCKGETDFCSNNEYCSAEALGCRCGPKLDKCKDDELCDGHQCYCEEVGKKRCSEGASCVYGKCSCQGGPDCNVGETCLNSGVCECKSGSGIACLRGETCDAHGICRCGSKTCSEQSADNCTNGQCRCGTGPACAANQACRNGQCACKERTCKTNEVCNSEGRCQCGVNQFCGQYESCGPEDILGYLRCACDLATCNAGERCENGSCTSCGLSAACLSECYPAFSLCLCQTDDDCRGAETCVKGSCLCGDDRSCRPGTLCIKADRGGRQCFKEYASAECYPNESNYTFKVNGESKTACICNTWTASDLRGCKSGHRCVMGEVRMECVEGYDLPNN